MSGILGKDYIGLAAGALITNNVQEILLVMPSRKALIDPGIWTRPVVEVSFGEPVADALARGLYEETGIHTSIVRSLDYLEYVDKDRGEHWITLEFLFKYKSGQPNNKDRSAYDRIGWFPLRFLPNNLSMHTKEMIDKYLM